MLHALIFLKLNNTSSRVKCFAEFSSPSVVRLLKMTINQPALTLLRDRCRSQRRWRDTKRFVRRLTGHDHGSANGLSVRLFQQLRSPRAELHHACLPLPLQLCLALVQSNYYLLLVVCNGTVLRSPPPPAITLHLIQPAVFTYIVPQALRGASRFSFARTSAHYANSQTSWVGASPAWRK